MSPSPLRLSTFLGELQRRYTQNPEAYDAFLRGWALVESFHVGFYRALEKLDAAREHFEEALTFDPEYPLALASLAVVKGCYYYFGVDRTPESLQNAEEIAHRALALDPQLPEAHMALGGAYAYQEAFEYALQLNPDNRGVYVRIGLLHLAQDNYNQALAQFDEARRMRETPGLLVQISAAFAALGDTEKALSELENALAGGYRDFARVDASPHFAAVRSDPRFSQLMSKYEGK